MYLTLERPAVRKLAKVLRIFIIVAVLFLLGLHVPCTHEWEEADCKKPKTCTLCGATEGKPLAHNWQDATCGVPKKCTLCQVTDGEPTGNHSWTPATCKAPKTCTICKLSDGEALEHTEGEWEVGTTDYVTASFRRELRCVDCHTLLDSEKVKLDTLHDDGIFIMSPDEYGERLNDAVKTVANLLRSSKKWMAVTGISNNSLVTAVGADYKDMGVVIYTDKIGVMGTTDQHMRGIDLIGVKLFTSDPEYMSTIMIAAVMASDPSLTTQDAATVVSKVTDRANRTSGYTLNGITYLVTGIDNNVVLAIS